MCEYADVSLHGQAASVARPPELYHDKRGFKTFHEYLTYFAIGLFFTNTFV